MKGKYYEKSVAGILYATEDIEKIVPDTLNMEQIVVRITKEQLGATLSLAAEELGVQICIPLEPLSHVLEVK